MVQSSFNLASSLPPVFLEAGLRDAGLPMDEREDLNSALSQARRLALMATREGEQANRRLGALLAALPAGVVVLDGQGRVVQLNPAANEILGAMQPGERWVEIVGRVFAPRWDDGHDVSLVDGRRVNVSTQALPGEPGQILLVQDVTETRRLQEQLSHHRRLSAKTEMAAALAHQIRTPLAAALLALGPLARASDLTPAQSRAAGRAMESMRQLERLVESMLSFARGAVVDAQPIVLGTLLARLCGEAETVLGEGRFTLDAGLASLAGVVIHGNADALISLMLNLLGNSRQIIGDECRVHLGYRELPGVLCLRFTDNGPGVPVAERARIFEPFYTTRRSGTGLGLPVAQAIARAHGGDLVLDDTCAEGACFQLSLPLMTTEHAA